MAWKSNSQVVFMHRRLFPIVFVFEPVLFAPSTPPRSPLTGTSQTDIVATMDNPLVEKADVVFHLSEFVNDQQFLFFALVCSSWRRAWRERPTATKAVTLDTSVAQLSYSVECGLNPVDKICWLSARYGRLDLLQWARSNDCPWDRHTCSMAAWGGHLAVLQWARANNCPWDESTCSLAASDGHPAVLQ